MILSSHENELNFEKKPNNNNSNKKNNKQKQVYIGVYFKKS